VPPRPHPYEPTAAKGPRCFGPRRPGTAHVMGNETDPGPQPTRTDKRWYFALMATCIGLFVLSWAVIDRFSSLAAIIVAAVAVAIPPIAVIVANVASASDRRRP
jgi:hypothetical protein